MPSELPFEILSIIASFISITDRFHCTTVCKSWTAAFKDSLRGVLIINPKNQQIVHHLLETEQEIRENDKVSIWALQMIGSLNISTKDFQRIHKRFPRLTYLKIREESLDPKSYRVHWSAWKSLKHLELDLPNLESRTQFSRILEILSCLPSLENLTLEDCTLNQAYHCTWFDLEKLCDYLPLLEFLRLRIKFDEISTATVDRFRSLVPEIRLRTLEICCEGMDLIWLFYFSIKFPNIHTYFWEIEQVTSSRIGQDSRFTSSMDGYDSLKVSHHEIMSVASKIPCFFPYLQTLTINERAIPTWRHISFWTLVHNYRIPLKHLYYRMNLSNVKPEVSEKIIVRCMDACVTKVTTLSMILDYLLKITNNASGSSEKIPVMEILSRG
ncbi:hypothetical protein J3Q64DRAFT_1694163 [Phycomyces blakesleeanus]|uniref:F-box domain-containing protein n=2 Tax=Phycomyces blakesleeanus TaxID=4837 RepID=A0A162V2X7_PHYB8|nr:hypothetical protein PHYBLDRAFT_58648 [Phycomyces blakesleeanus NRRL 1555(-)]OAD79602.1 hypothetical protein PHYBLDRAFT_58648 [Phycomyces blakesleeanus NRRL 1555(-)]|eukprot:XP_018297642.1 hypothetical protein PHYBLDRAFT_58648 [Phycomyces blakesleeanus NRRL 1555(-)]